MGPASVRITVCAQNGRWELLEAGPGDTKKRLEFRDADALYAYHAKSEAHLLARGFVLSHTTAERRSGTDRRRRSRSDRRQP
jgi:hypothetical protein